MSQVQTGLEFSALPVRFEDLSLWALNKGKRAVLDFHNRPTWLVCFAVVIGTAGCVPSIGPAYVPSVETGAAHVTFISESGGVNLAVSALAGSMKGCLCSSTTSEIVGIIHNKAALVQGSSDYADKGKDSDRVSVYVPSGREFRFMLPAAQYRTELVGHRLWKTTTTYCQPHAGFVPDPRSRYEVVFDAAIDPCDFSVYKVLEGRREKLIASKYPLCLQSQNAEATDKISVAIREKCEESGR